MMPEEPQETPVPLLYATPEEVGRILAKWALAIGVVSTVSTTLGIVIWAIFPQDSFKLATMLEMLVLYVAPCLGGIALVLGIVALIKDRTDWPLAICAILFGLFGLAPAVLVLWALQSMGPFAH
jgi:hypothetical protein